MSYPARAEGLVNSTIKTVTEAKDTTSTNTIAVPVSQTPTSTIKKKKKQHPPEKQPEDMETTTSLKRRRDSGDSNKKGGRKNNARKTNPNLNHIPSQKNNHKKPSTQFKSCHLNLHTQNIAHPNI